MKYYIQEEKVFADLSNTLLEWSPGQVIATGMDPAIFQRLYKDEYRGAILQGYTPEQAQMKAAAVATADFLGGQAVSSVISAPENLGHATSVGTAGITSPITSLGASGLNIAANSIAGDMSAAFVGNWFDKKYGKGKHDPDGEKKYEFSQAELDAVPYDDTMVGNFITAGGALDQDKIIQNINSSIGVGNLLPKGKEFRQWAKDNGYPEWVGNIFDANRTKEEEKADATKQREDLGVKEAPGGGYVVDDQQYTADSDYGAETDKAYDKRMKEARKLADKLNQQLIDKGFRPKGWKPQPLGSQPPAQQPPAQQPESEVQQTQPTNNNTPPVPSPLQHPDQGPGPRVGPPPQNPGVTPPPDTPGTPGTPTPAEPAQQPQAQNNGAEQKPEQQAQPQADPGESEAQQQKNLTPMQQWAQKYPHLAQRLKPGQTGYDEVKDMKVVQNAKQPTAGGIERRTAGPLIKPDKTAQQNAAKVKQELQQARQNVDRAQQTQQRVATQNAQRAQDERTPTDPIMRAASKVRDAGQKYGDKAFSTTLRPQKGFEPLTKKKIGDPLGESLDGLMDYLLD